MLSRVQILFSTPLPGDFLESFASTDSVLIGLPPSTIALWEPSLWTRVIFDRQLEKDQKAIRTGFDKVWGNSTFVLFTGCLWNLNKQWRQFYQHQLWRNNMRNDRACMILVPQLLHHAHVFVHMQYNFWFLRRNGFCITLLLCFFLSSQAQKAWIERTFLKRECIHIFPSKDPTR